MDPVANCIVECFNQKDYSMYANCEQVLLKATLGELVSQNVNSCVSSTQSLSLIPYEFSSLLAESYHSFRQGEGVAGTLHKCR